MISPKHEILFRESLNFKVVEFNEIYYIVRDMFSDFPVALIELVRSGTSLYRSPNKDPMKFKTPRDALKFWVDGKNLDHIRSAFGYDQYEFLNHSNIVCNRDQLIEQYPELII